MGRVGSEIGAGGVGRVGSWQKDRRSGRIGKYEPTAKSELMIHVYDTACVCRISVVAVH